MVSDVTFDVIVHVDFIRCNRLLQLVFFLTIVGFFFFFFLFLYLYCKNAATAAAGGNNYI